jgi:large subunit ribosomal protein L5
MENLKEKLAKEIYPKLADDFNIKNKMRILKPIVGYVQIGIGKMITQNPENKLKIEEDATYILEKITGQKPKIIVCKKAIAGFKLRGNETVALLVTLRRNRLLEFIDRLLTYVLPRIKDFNGLKGNNFDKKGNVNLGIKEHSIFPETISDKIKTSFGLQVILIGSGRSKDENLKLWEYVGFPIKL